MDQAQQQAQRAVDTSVMIENDVEKIQENLQGIYMDIYTWMCSILCFV
jgi:hypothetical protein